PQTVDSDRHVAIRQLAHKYAAGRVKRMDVSVAKVANEDGVPQVAKARGRVHETPRGVQRTPRSEVPHQIAICIEDIHEAISNSADVVVLLVVLLSIGHVESAIHVLDPERRIAAGQ